MNPFKRVAIIGVGFIGGSIGIDIKKKGLAGCVVGIGRDRGRLKKAVACGAIDEWALDYKEGLRGADLVIISVPVIASLEIIKSTGKLLDKECIVMDVGSTKAEVVRCAQKYLCRGVHFVGCHPMAGSEKPGIAAARSDLFRGAVCIVAREKNTSPGALRKVRKLWLTLGTRVAVMDPSQHDRIVATISHLPHLVATGLVLYVKGRELEFASSGFRDTTRVSSGDPVMWRDICLTNRQNIVSCIDRFTKRLNRIRGMIEQADGCGLAKEFERAGWIRRNVE
jgi:prephenate dehydrogenase